MRADGQVALWGRDGTRIGQGEEGRGRVERGGQRRGRERKEGRPNIFEEIHYQFEMCFRRGFFGGEGGGGGAIMDLVNFKLSIASFSP